jgi:hypothetical protein
MTGVHSDLRQRYNHLGRRHFSTAQFHEEEEGLGGENREEDEERCGGEARMWNQEGARNVKRNLYLHKMDFCMSCFVDGWNAVLHICQGWLECGVDRGLRV